MGWSATEKALREAVGMVLDAGTGGEGYDPSDAEICDAIDWDLLRRVVAS